MLPPWLDETTSPPLTTPYSKFYSDISFITNYQNYFLLGFVNEPPSPIILIILAVGLFGSLIVLSVMSYIKATRYL